MQRRYPLPTRVLSNGEFRPLAQTHQQKLTEKTLESLAVRFGRKLGWSRRRFLGSTCGMAAAFLAMNSVYGGIFDVLPAEASEPEAAEAIRKSLDQQFIFDVQLHYVRDQYAWQGLAGLRRYARNWNKDLGAENSDLEKIKFDNFIDEVFLQSQTKIGLLSGAPSDDPQKWFLTNDEIAKTRSVINGIAGSRRLLAHAIFTPGQPGWLEEIDRAIETLHPDSWKGYTIGDPLGPSRYPWRLDDEQLVYPAYEKMVKAGIRNVCIHKGLLPDDYQTSFPDLWRYATVDDVGKAARDWPRLNFIIYHAALRPLQDFAPEYLSSFEANGYIPWVSELAAIPAKFKVDNVYAELGTAFASSAVTYPRHCAVLLSTLIKGLGVDKVLWGTDSVWYGSPQWQIEAFRRIEIPADLQEKFALPPLGKADGLVKSAIFGLNSARLYDVALAPKTLSLLDRERISARYS
ncbi:MAG: amidohydrolase family protein [Deltaproteobacteria bacterium]|nr:amidohydrolase family protein [Deltaproteobacteria bacterium]